MSPRRADLYRRLRQAKRHLEATRERLRLGLEVEAHLSPETGRMYDDALSQAVVLQQRLDHLLEAALADGGRWPNNEDVRSQDDRLAVARQPHTERRAS